MYESDSGLPGEGGRTRKVIVSHWLADGGFAVGSVRHVIDAGLELRSVSGRVRMDQQQSREGSPHERWAEGGLGGPLRRECDPWPNALNDNS